MPTLVIETGTNKGTTVALGPGADLLLGTDSVCDLRIDDARASARHCKLKEFKGRYYVKDLRSETGTLVNDHTVDQGELKDGDRLRVGETVLAFVSDEGAGALVGKEIGGYRILARIGQGGMGAVYRALQISLHREVALKILKPSLTKDQHFIEQFMREARAAGALNHPHICQVYDVGQAGNIYYYSMEYIPNGSVEDLLNQHGPPPVDEAVRLVLEAAEALEYAELKHIVHRDIKPANLMLTELRQVKIADLGLARSLKESAEKEATGTLGTPHFISPEQALRKEVDIRSDIYSLGATFYRILTGKTPFEGATVQEILRKQVKDEPKSVRELRPEVPERVERVLQRMLRKDPAERHATAAELVAELESLRQKKHSKALLVGALVVAVLGVAGAVFAYVRGQREPEKIIVEKATTDPNAARQLRETMDEKQRLQLELQARDARDQLSSSITGEERVQALRALAQKYAGTKVAQEAEREADEVDAAAKREGDARRQRQAAIDKLGETTRAALTAALQAQDFGKAVDLACDLGKGTEVEGAGELNLTRNELLKQVDDEVIKAHAQAVAAFQSGPGAAATRLAPIDNLLAKLKSVAERLSGAELASLAGAVADLDQRHTAALANEQKQLAEQERDDLKKTASILSGASVRGQLLELQLNDVLNSARALEGELKSAAYRERIAGFRSDLEGLSRLMSRFRSTVESGSLKDVTIRDLVTGDEAKIVALVNHSGLRAEYSRGVGTVATTIKLAQYASGPGLVELLFDRWEQDADDLTALVRAAMLFASVRAGEKFAPLADAVQAYNPDAGWAAVRGKLGSLSTADLAPPDLTLVAKKLAKLDPARAAEVEAWLESERSAFLEAARALTPFLGGEGLGFGQAAQLLHELVRQHPDSSLVAAFYPVFDGGRFELSLAKRK